MAIKSSTKSNLILVLVSTIMALVLLEGASRLFYYLRWGELYDSQWMRYSMRLGWELQPGSYLRFDINQQGFRRPTDVSLEVPENTVRVFLVGGSTAFGTNGLYPQFDPVPLEYEDTIDYHMQKILQDRYPGLNFEVINAGVSESRLYQEITLFREKLLNFDPDLVVFLDGHNDISFLTLGSSISEWAAPYWNTRHTDRGARVLNSSSVMGPFYYADIYLGRVSYFYYGMTSLLQELQNLAGGEADESNPRWGSDSFRIADEAQLVQKYAEQLQDLDEVLPLYLDQLGDLAAIATARKAKVLYALQPELVIEEPAQLSARDTAIQNFTFQHHGDFGTLGWRYMAPRISARLEKLSNEYFRGMEMLTIADGSGENIYTDYCHLTSRGNQVVAENLYPVVAEMLELK
ncbi:MAG: hypothetical protein QGG46_00675 [Gammaproteobacteria bacterium]|jgi:hypothetical protein|nr:hypothetical protein [Gammaproteobacteria bacterium]